MNIDNLEKLAMEATPGPWVTNHTGHIGPMQSDGFVYNLGEIYNSEDKYFIAAANPAAILELISINRELVAALELQVNFDEHEYSRQVVDNISLRVLDKIGKTISSGSDYTSPELDLELTDDAIKLALMAWFDNKTTDEDAMREAINASIKRSKQ